MFSGYRDEDLRDRRHTLDKRYRTTSGLFAVSIIAVAAVFYVCTSVPPSSMPVALAELTSKLRDSSLAGFFMLVLLVSSGLICLASAMRLSPLNRQLRATGRDPKP
jgi:hypothetical protein